MMRPGDSKRHPAYRRFADCVRSLNQVRKLTVVRNCGEEKCRSRGGVPISIPVCPMSR